MHRYLVLILLIFSLKPTANAQHRDSLTFGGQASAWINYNPDQAISLNSGIRYIPQLNYEINSGKRKLDFEFSLNLTGNTGIRPFDSISGSADAKPYRAWMRYSGRQFELRLGLQKINFGSAAFLRPLMWFDQTDPRDPLQLTGGVWGLLGRYYFLNNANIWIWALYPSDKPKAWEFTKTHKDIPEAGGRIQLPAANGEIAFSYHWRITDTRENQAGLPLRSKVQENRFGIDGKWDLGAGVWFEASHTSHNQPLNALTYQRMLATGADYTFGIGNGLNFIVENILVSSGEQVLSNDGLLDFTGFSASYPLSISSNINAIFYVDWKNGNTYNFLNLKKQIRLFDLYLMAFYNPENYLMPGQAPESNYFAGKGIQIMIVFNH